MITKENKIHTDTQNENKIHTDTQKINKIHKNVSKDEWVCSFCNKVFSQNSSLNRHKRLYCKKNTYNLEIERLKKELEEKNKQIAILQRRSHMTTNNIDNSTTYNINIFGNENIDHLEQVIPSLLFEHSPEKAMTLLPQKIYKDTKHPENQTVQMKLDKTKYARVSGGCGKWLIMKKTDVLDSICKSDYQILKDSWSKYDKLQRYATDRYFTLANEWSLPWNDKKLLTDIKLVLMNDPVDGK